MSKQLYTVSKEGLEYLCGLINKIVTLPSDVISDITLSTNKTMSSVKIDKIIKQCLQDANEYSNEVVNSLTHLVAEKIDFEPTLDNTTDKINTLLLYSANSDNNYTQYLRLTNELLNLGDTSLSLNEYMKEVDADTKYTLKTTTDTLTTEVTNIKTDFNTHKDDTDIHTSADEKALYALKSKITDTIDSTSTSDDIASAKGVYDNAIKNKNINTYTTLEQLGLVSGCTVEDIYKALPDNSYCEIGCSSSTGSSLYVVTNVPLETSNTYGLLSIRKFNKYRFSIEYKFSGGGVLLPNTLYIGQLKGADGTGLTWKRVCTTSVADIPVTDISMSSTYTSNANCKYQVVNGVCYIDFMSGTYKLTSNVNGVILATGLPIPRTGQVCTTYVPWSCADASKQVILFVNGNGELILHASVNANATPVFCTFSYPVK